MQKDQPNMREGSYDEFKAWVQGMDTQFGNWEEMDEKVEKLCIDGEKLLEGTQTGGQRIPRSRILIKILFNI